jgi:predicted  nucleic acid-binding Zn-ribbon protein
MPENDLQTVIKFFQEQLKGFRDDFKEELSSIATEIKALNASVNEIKMALSRVDNLSGELKETVKDIIKRVTVLESCNSQMKGVTTGSQNTLKFVWGITGGIIYFLLNLLTKILIK